MNIQSIPLDQLRPHPDNSNVMPEHLLAKLTEHIRRHDRYPPLIVRPMHRPDAGGPDAYEILDGHHRAEVLRRLGKPTAFCLVWEANDQDSLWLLATLNRLRGRDDPHRRAELVSRLAEDHEITDLSRLLPEHTEQLRKLVSLHKAPPPPRAPQPVQDMPVAVHFFLLPDQRKRLLARLKAIGGSREDALMTLVDQSHG